MIYVNPLNILQKGYTLTYHDDKLITSVSHLKTNEKIKIKYHDGVCIATVNDIERE